MNMEEAFDFCWSHGVKIEFTHSCGTRRIKAQIARYVMVERYTFIEACEALKKKVDDWLASGRTLEEM